MKIGTLIFFVIPLASYCLEHSGSPTPARSPRSPREELQIVGNVERTQEFNKQNQVTCEIYTARLASNSIISIHACYRKNEISYVGIWKRAQKPERTMAADCARTYCEKLKRAYLQNTPLL